jgi:hypothetical protein
MKVEFIVTDFSGLKFGDGETLNDDKSKEENGKKMKMMSFWHDTDDWADRKKCLLDKLCV